MSTLSLTRSPRYIRTASLASATYFKLELYIFTGVIGDKPGTATYTLNKDIINSETSVTFEINELVRDYYEVNFNGTYTSSTGQVLWVIADVEGFTASSVVPQTGLTFLAFDGYTNFKDNANFNYIEPALVTASAIQVLDTDYTIIPVNAEIAETVNFKLNGATVSTHSITDNGNTNQKIQYITTTALNVDQVDVVYDSGAKTQTFIVEVIDECKYPVNKVVFLNKLGALQNLYFFKKSAENLEVKRDVFQRNLLNEVALTYDVFDHQSKNFNIMGNESIVLNTGYVLEAMNDSFKELLLSQYVWMLRGAVTYPMNVKDSNIAYKTALNDRLINYTINFSYSFDTINNVH